MSEAPASNSFSIAAGACRMEDVPAGYKHTIVGVIPEEWEACTIGAVADIGNGGTPKTGNTNYWNGDIPWCVPTDVTGTPGKYLSVTERRISAAGLANSAASLLPAGSLLLCSRATIGDVRIATIPICVNQGFKPLVCKDGIDNEYLYYVVLTLRSQMLERASGSTFQEIGKGALSTIRLAVPPPGPATLNSGVFVIRPKNNSYFPKYMYYILTSRIFDDFLVRLQAGSTISHLYQKDFAGFSFNAPQMDEQRAIAAVLSDMDAEIVALERRRDKTRAVKQGMMQQLLTGRVRLVEPKTITERLAATRPAKQEAQRKVVETKDV